MRWNRCKIHRYLAGPWKLQKLSLYNVHILLCIHFVSLCVKSYIPNTTLSRISTSNRRKIRLRKENAKCRYLKNLPVKGLCYRCLSVIQYTYSRRKGGRGEPERRLEGQQFTKQGRKYQNDWLYLQSLHSAAKFLCRSIFLDDDILLWCIYD